MCGISMYITHPFRSVDSSHLQVITPQSVKVRLLHSITATSLGPGLTEVLVFGGKLKWSGEFIAKTIIMRFGERIELQDYGMNSKVLLLVDYITVYYNCN